MTRLVVPPTILNNTSCSIIRLLLMKVSWCCRATRITTSTQAQIAITAVKHGSVGMNEQQCCILTNKNPPPPHFPYPSLPISWAEGHIGFKIKTNQALTLRSWSKEMQPHKILKQYMQYHSPFYRQLWLLGSSSMSGSTQWSNWLMDHMGGSHSATAHELITTLANCLNTSLSVSWLSAWPKHGPPHQSYAQSSESSQQFLCCQRFYTVSVICVMLLIKTDFEMYYYY